MASFPAIERKSKGVRRPPTYVCIRPTSLASFTMSETQKQAALRKRFEAGRGSWDADWECILQLHPDYLEAYVNMRDAAQGRSRLPGKIQEFIYIAVAACTTHIHAPTVRAHTRAAITLGATASEISEVIGLTYLVGIHTVTLGAPILLELLEEQGMELSQSADLASEKKRIKEEFIRRRGFWTDTWNPLLDTDATFFEAYMDFSSFASSSSTLEPKYREIVVLAFDAATHHLYARGTKIHMRNAMALGATPEEIMEALEITSLAGMNGVTTSMGIVHKVLNSA